MEIIVNILLFIIGIAWSQIFYIKAIDKHSILPGIIGVMGSLLAAVTFITLITIIFQ